MGTDTTNILRGWRKFDRIGVYWWALGVANTEGSQCLLCSSVQPLNAMSHTDAFRTRIIRCASTHNVKGPFQLGPVETFMMDDDAA